MSNANDKVKIPYGQQSIALDLRSFPARPTLITVCEPEPAADPVTVISEALEKPIGAAPLRTLVKRGDRVVILVSDITRPCGARQFMPILLNVLNDAGVSDKDITVIFALGMHRPNTLEEKRRIVGEAVASRVKMVDHDARHEKAHVYLGTTSFKNDVLLNRGAVEADKLILTGTIGYHLFAGFGGGRKALLPGVAFYRTILYNHMLTLTTQASGWHPCARAGMLKGNPTHEDMSEAARMAKPTFLLNTVLNSRHDLVKVFAGDCFRAFEEGCQFYDRHYSLPVQQKADLVIVSCGGYPKDINFIQSHKSMDYAMNILREGGVMIALAECAEGLGNPTFLDWFRYSTLAEFEQWLKESYLHIPGGMNAQTAYSLFSKTQRATIILVSSLPPEAVRKMGMLPASTLDAALAVAKERLGSQFTTHIIPVGGYLRVFVDKADG